MVYLTRLGQASDPTLKAGCERSRNIELALLLTGVIASRLGLWMFDLAVSQLLQEQVRPTQPMLHIPQRFGVCAKLSASP